MLLLDAEMLRGDYAVLFSALLLVLSMALVGVVSASAAVEIRLSLAKDRKLAVLNQQLMVDKKNDQEKFAAAWERLVGEGEPGDEARALEILGALTRRSALPNGKQPVAKQVSALADVDALLEEAEEEDRDFHIFFRDFVEEFDGEYKRGMNKKRERAVEKVRMVVVPLPLLV